MSAQILSLIRILLTADLAMVALHFALGGGTRFFDLDREHNLPTWFAGLQLALLALAAHECWLAERKRSVDATPPRASFAILAGFFLYLSLDEITVLHEGVLRDAVRDLLPRGSLWVSLLPWQLVFGPLLLAMEILMLALFVTRFGGRRDLLVPGLGGLACWGGAVLAEAIAKPLFMSRGRYRIEVALEEGLELFGATLLIVTFARYARVAEAGDVQPLEIGVRRRRIAAAIAGALAIVAIGAVVVVASSLANSAWLYHHNGELLAKRKKWTEAAAAFEEAHKREPDDLETLRDLARAYAHLPDYERALTAYDEAIRLQAEDPTLKGARATVLYRLGRYEEAEAGYRDAIAIAPRDAKLAANHGFALEKLGRTEEALDEYRRALTEDAKQRLARKRLNALLAHSVPKRP